MPTTPQEIWQSLMASDPEFRRLAEEHSRYEAQLEEIRTRLFLNSEDLVQQMTLKKLKLRVKDRMEALIAEFRQRNAQR